MGKKYIAFTIAVFIYLINISIIYAESNNKYIPPSQYPRIFSILQKNIDELSLSFANLTKEQIKNIYIECSADPKCNIYEKLEKENNFLNENKLKNKFLSRFKRWINNFKVKAKYFMKVLIDKLNTFLSIPWLITIFTTKKDYQEIENLRNKITKNYSISINEDGSIWTFEDLDYIDQVMSVLPKKFWDNGKMTVVKQKQDLEIINVIHDILRPILKFKYPRGCNRGFLSGSETYGFVTPQNPNTIFLCSVISGNKDNLQGTIYHEFTHNFQKQISNDEAKYGLNVLDKPESPLYKFYSILFQISQDHWEPKKEVFENVTIPSCFGYKMGLNSEKPGPIFISSYECMNTLTPKALSLRNKYSMPEEAMAEEIRIYYQNPKHLRDQDLYFISNRKLTQRNLNRYREINNILK